VKLLLDTHILIWAVSDSARLPIAAHGLIGDRQNQPVFSIVSLWEIAIKNRLGRPDFRNDVKLIRRSLVDKGYMELSVTGAHTEIIDTLPPIHKDPFDRMLVAQAIADEILLLTSDPMIAKYPGPVRLV
jgi:PIN domain nuclease of toxin-antitoxin system